MQPIIIINFKTYEQGTGENALNLAGTAQKVAEEESVNIAVAVQFADIFRISSDVSIPVLSQHIDPIEFGSNTGHVLAESIKEAGAYGTLLNHAEKKISDEDLERCVKICKAIGLKTVVCAETVKRAVKIAAYHPDYIAYEDPELIGTGKPISKLRVDAVKQFVERIKEINPDTIPICGAGISNLEDVKAALELGTKGVLPASAVLKAEDPEEVIRDMAKGLKYTVKFK
jgi:triosephosphate isomerase